MFDQLMDPAFLPFVVAGITVLVLAVLEVLAVVLGWTVSDVIDSLLPGVDIEAGDAPGVLSWLGFGKAPFLVVLIVILACFAITGILIQHILLTWTGTTLWPALAVILALAITLPSASFLSGVLARLIPADETSGIHRDHLVGCHGHIAQGVASHDRPAEAQVTGPKGLRHWIMVRAERGESLSPGTPIRVIARESRTLFVARRSEEQTNQALPG